MERDLRDDGCIVCPAHGSAFDLRTGTPEGEWCPGLPTLPLVGKPPREPPSRSRRTTCASGGGDDRGGRRRPESV